MIDTNLVRGSYFVTYEKLKFFKGTLKALEDDPSFNDPDIISDLKKKIMLLEVKKDTLKYVLTLDGVVDISQMVPV